ncbi:MAG: hypothetical protein IKM08_06140 [Clostridia bacterium]|nr:hypothetical protein [Clostridia bacterium]
MNSFKKYYLFRILLTTIFCAALGVLFLLAEPYADEIFDIILIAMGLMTVVMNLPPMVCSLFRIKRRGEWISFVISLVAVVFGVVVTLVQRDVLLLVLGLYSVMMPAVRVLLVAERKKQLKRELPNILFGLFMVFVSVAEIEDLIFLVCGIGMLAIAVLYLLWGLITMKIRSAAYDACVRELALTPLEDQPELLDEAKKK